MLPRGVFKSLFLPCFKVSKTCSCCQGGREDKIQVWFIERLLCGASSASFVINFTQIKILQKTGGEAVVTPQPLCGEVCDVKESCLCNFLSPTKATAKKHDWVIGDVAWNSIVFNIACAFSAKGVGGLELTELPKASSFKSKEVVFCLHGLTVSSGY